LNKNPEEVDQRSADMWSFAILLWEMSTREVPFVDMPPMEVGMKVRYSRWMFTNMKIACI
jgi:integrin-linked kinase